MTNSPWSRIVASAALAAASLLGSGAAAAQQARNAIPLQTTILREDGVSVPTNPSSRRNGFNLFAEEDLAGTSLRLTGLYRYVLINAGGLCPFANTAGDIFNTACGDGVFFHVTPVWGIGLDDYAKIQQVWPEVSTMRAPVGFSTPWRITSIAPITVRINAADGQFGQFYAGTTSLTGAGCREFTGNSGGGLPENFTLLAASDCPETWSGTGFNGMRQIPDSVWLQRKQANPTAFRWDDWKIPASQLGAKTVGNLTTYGAFSDYNREMLQLYGGVTPMGVAGQPPGERGFPLGIYVRADAWKFDRPSLRDGAYIRWIVVNNSEKVWGTPINYDKLYMGIDPGYILSGQSPAAYNLPGRGAHIASGGGMSGKCNNTTYPRRRLPGVNEGCEGGSSIHTILILKSPLGDLRNKMFSDVTSPFYAPGNPEADDTITFNHWRRGGFGQQEQFSWRRNDRALFGLLSGNEELWLDGRNFSDFSSGQIWSFFRYEGTDGTQSRANIRYNRFVPGAAGTGYGTWDWNEDGIQDTIMVPDCGGGANDGVVGGSTGGCSALWQDTIAGGYSNQIAGNIGNFLGVGPFALAAGDTTEFIFFMGRSSESNTDTLAVNRFLVAATSAFFQNYAGASSYPTPTFTAADVALNSAWFRDSVSGAQNTQIRIQVKMPPKQDDEFLKSVVDRLNQIEPVANNLRQLNPTLVAEVQARMRQNLAQVLVFKSCDNGASWTTDGGCTSATANFRTRDQNGADIGLGWRPFATLNADETTGILNSYIITDNVQSGREYLYSFVTKTRGLADIQVTTGLTFNTLDTVVVIDTVNVGPPLDTDTTITFVPDTTVTGQAFANLRDVLAIDIDTITSPLSPNGPHTVKAYAPLSVPAGTIYARLDTSRAQGQAATNRVSNAAQTAGTDGTFRMRFGNRWVVTRTIDTASGAETSTIIRQSVYYTYNDSSGGRRSYRTQGDGAHAGAALSPAGPRLQSPGAGTSFTYVTSADTFTSNAGFTYSARTNADGSIHSSRAFAAAAKDSVGSVKTYIDTINAAGYVIGRGASGTDPYYLAVGNNGTGGNIGSFATNFTTTGGNDSSIVQNTGPFESAPWFPGFTATITGETLSPGTRLSIVLRANTGANRDTLDAGVVSGNGVVYVNVGDSFGVKQPTDGARGGFYRVNWQGDSYGPGGPFTWGTNAQMQPVIDASLAARPVATFGDTTTALRTAILASPTNNVAGRPLVRARVPFTVVGPGGGPSKLLMVQRHQSGNVADSLFRNSILLGTNGDTTRVAIPPDAWMPGDTLWMFENLSVDSTATVGAALNVKIVRDTVINGRTQTLPIQVSKELLSLKFVLRCNSNVNPTRTTCNPIRLSTRGSSGYLPFENGWTTVLHFNRNFDQNSEVTLVAQPTRASALPLTKLDMQRIQVVPNPYVVQSSFDQLSTGRATINSRVRFVNVPEEGTVRIYTISGQLVQQLSWTASDLIAPVNGSQTGDLPFSLRTREGLDLGSGLYLFIMTAKGAQATMACENPDTGDPLIDPNTNRRLSCENVARGKFVIIR